METFALTIIIVYFCSNGLRECIWEEELVDYGIQKQLKFISENQPIRF
jgi:hypothetical protein